MAARRLVVESLACNCAVVSEPELICGRKITILETLPGPAYPGKPRPDGGTRNG